MIITTKITCPVCYTENEADATFCSVCGTSFLEPQTAQYKLDELRAGAELLGGKYRVLESIGRGGFGITYRAYQASTKGYVAIKELFPEGMVERDADTGEVKPKMGEARALRNLITRFEIEAETMRSIRHPAAVMMFENWEENGTTYLSMEMLEGETLETLVARRGKLSEALARKWIVPLLECLFDLHERDFLHRDIKPNNIMIVGGEPVLIDFGSVEGFAPRDSVRVKHRVITPAYAPLEQYAAEAKLGPYTDLYSLGATFYEAITGVPPPSAIERSKGARLVPVQRINESVSPKFASVLEWLLEERIADRPQSAQHVLHELGLVDIATRVKYSIKSLDEQTGVVQRSPGHHGHSDQPGSVEQKVLKEQVSQVQRVIVLVFVFVVFGVYLFQWLTR